MMEDFTSVLQVTITKGNLALWSKSFSQRLQEVILGLVKLWITKRQSHHNPAFSLLNLNIDLVFKDLSEG